MGIRDILAGQLVDENIRFIRDYKFLHTRDFEFDFAILKDKVAIECDTETYGRPAICPICNKPIRRRTKSGKFFVVTETNMSRDDHRLEIQKYNLACLNRWRVLRFSPEDIRSGDAISFIKIFLAEKERQQ